MKRAGRALVGLLAAVWLSGCSVPLLPTPLPTLTVTPSPLPPTPTVTPEPSPTPLPTPIPTPDPSALPGVAAEGLGSVGAQAGSASLICMRYEDTDGDGMPEWLAVVHQPEERLSAFVLDGDVTYPLTPMQPEPGKRDIGLGQYAACEVTVRDVNNDGRPEVAIFGHADANETLMHLYVWDEGSYRLMGAFRGTSGVFFEDADGDLAEEIIEGHRDQGASDLTWHVIFTWDGQTYGWTTDRWRWTTLRRPHAYPTYRPEYAVISFYLALNDRDLPGAYALLSPEAQAGSPYETWAAGFDRTLRVDAGSVRPLSGVGDETHRRVVAMVTAWDNEEGRVVGRTWDVEWETVLTPDGWRLGSGTTNLLTTWDAPYWR